MKNLSRPVRTKKILPNSHNLLLSSKKLIFTKRHLLYVFWTVVQIHDR